MKELKGAIFVIISAVIFGCMPVAAKYIYAAGGNSTSLTVYRYVLPLPVLLFLALREQRSGLADPPRSAVLKRTLHISGFQLGQFIILSIGFCMTPLLLFTSYNYISSGSATTIHFSYPVFVILASSLLYRQRMTVFKNLGVLFCILGLTMFYKPGLADGTMGITLSMASGITYTFYMMYFDRSELKLLKPFKMNLYLSVFSAAVALCFSLTTGSFVLLTTPSGWLMALVFSLMVSVCATILFQKGIALIGTQKSAVLSTFEPITSVVLGFLLFGEDIGIRTAAGVIFILASVLCITFFDKGQEGKTT